MLHGLGDGPIVVSQIDSMIQIGPFGRGDLWYRGLGEEDVFECIDLAKQIFSIDEDRVYLCGFSMGGAGTFELGLKHPDVWAACVPVCGRLADLSFVDNGLNLPFWINAGSEDNVVPAKFSRKVYDEALKVGLKNWKYTEYEGMGHSFYIDWKKKIEPWLLEQKRAKRPDHVTFNCYSPAKAYWVEILKKENKDFIARFEARVKGQKIEIRTKNIADYMIYMDDVPIDSNRSVSIIENDETIFRGTITETRVLQRTDSNNLENRRGNGSRGEKPLP